MELKYILIRNDEYPFFAGQVWEIVESTSDTHHKVKLLGDQDLARINHDPEWENVKETEHDSGDIETITDGKIEKLGIRFRSYAGFRALVANNQALIEKEIRRFLGSYNTPSTVTRILNGKFKKKDEEYPARFESVDGVACFWTPNRVFVSPTRRYYQNSR